MSNYLLDNAAPAARTRLEALATVFDPTTIRHFETLGVADGWRCWEIGAGGPSIVRWLAQQVGDAGRVLATDLDVTWANAAAGANVEIARHDIGLDPPPAGMFDLIHARLVLVHVGERDRALHAIVRSLAPGGWLLIEDADPALQPLICVEVQTPAHELANKLRTDFRALLVERGADLAYGRRLPRLLREAGLVEVAADAYFAIAMPGCAALERTTIEHVRDRLLASGRATATEIDRHLANVDAGAIDAATSPLISAWGRRPR